MRQKLLFMQAPTGVGKTISTIFPAVKAVSEELADLSLIHICVGVEKTWPLHSPNVEKVEIVRKGKVRRAKLYYLRDRKSVV